METIEYSNLARREVFSFWHKGRREILHEALLRNLDKNNLRKILDVGCGTGGNMSILKDFGQATGVDFFGEALKFAQGQNFTQLIQADVTHLPLPDESFSLVSALDVLEHIKDDEAALKEVWRVLSKDGLFLVTVPAYRWLWSQHDVTLHHVRRYVKCEIINKLQKAGFEILESSHFVMLAVFVTCFRKLRDKFFFKGGEQPHVYDVDFSPTINAILLFFLRCEKILIRFLSLPFGTSIMVVARKLPSVKL